MQNPHFLPDAETFRCNRDLKRPGRHTAKKKMPFLVRREFQFGCLPVERKLACSGNNEVSIRIENRTCDRSH